MDVKASIQYNPTDPDYLAKTMGEAVAGDDLIQAAVRSLAKLAIAEAARVMSTGTPAQKAALLTKFLPYMAKSLTADTGDETMSELRDEFMKMRAEIMTATRAKHEPETAPEPA